MIGLAYLHVGRDRLLAHWIRMEDYFLKHDQINNISASLILFPISLVLWGRENKFEN